MTGSLTVYAILFGMCCTYLQNLYLFKFKILKLIYIFLLFVGDNTLNPWGCIQSYCCCYARKTRSLLRKSFPTMALESSPFIIASSDSSTSSNDLLLQQSALGQQLDSLKLFLKEYVVDSTYLENLNNDEGSNKLSKLLGKFYWRSNNK